jgi:predicted transcriptional regulator
LIEEIDWEANRMAKTEREKISIYVSGELHKSLKMLAVARDQDISEVYAEAMRDIIAKYDFQVTIKSPN